MPVNLGSGVATLTFTAQLHGMGKPPYRYGQVRWGSGVKYGQAQEIYASEGVAAAPPYAAESIETPTYGNETIATPVYS